MLSASATVSPASTATGVEFSENVTLPPALIAGASLRGTIVTEELAGVDISEALSVTIHLIVRLVVGLSTDEEKVTDFSAVT